MKTYLFTLINLIALSFFSCNSETPATTEEETQAVQASVAIEDEPVIQKLEPVKWTYSSEKISDTEYKLTFDATIDESWYVYSSTVADDGPIPTSINFDDTTAIQSKAAIEEDGAEVKDGYDEMFDMDIKKFGKSASFSQIVSLNESATTITGYLEFMTCDSTQCIFPDPIEFTLEAQ